MQIYDELVARGLIAQTTDEDEIRDLVNNGKAVFYIGFDPTADSLHVGHFMALCLMKRLQMAGNKPIALIGGGTAMIGDPSGRTDMRQMMTKETIQHNVDCFKKQMSKFIDFSEDKALLVNNADWLLDLNYVDVLRDVGACFSVNNMLRAECYKQRMEKGLSFLEFNYMIMQSYDFYALYQKYGCNMQFGGDDQWSNMLGGTELIRRKLGKDAYAMTITLLLNSEGIRQVEQLLEMPRYGFALAVRVGREIDCFCRLGILLQLHIGLLDGRTAAFVQALPLHLAHVVHGVYGIDLYAEHGFDSLADLGLVCPLIDREGVGLVCKVVVALLGEYGADDYIMGRLHYAYTSSIFATESLVRMRVLYLRISYTFRVLTRVVFTPGMFLAARSTISSLSLSTMSALPTFMALSTFTISLVLGFSMSSLS